jgi:O-antigen ligase
MSPTRQQPINIILLLAFVSGSCYGEGSPIYQVFLYIPVGLVALLASWHLLSSRQLMARPGLAGTVNSGLAITIFALIGAAAQNDPQSAEHAVLFLIIWMSAVVFATSVRLEQVTRSFAYAGAIVILGFALVDHTKIAASLAVTGIGADTLERYGGPFDTHPNLIGHVVGCFVVALFWQARAERLAAKVIFYAAIIAGFILTIAASSRGGLFAASGTILCVIGWQRIRSPFALVGILLFVSGIVLGAMVIFPSTLERLDVLLDLSGAHRGLSTGLSGRTALWQKLLDQFGTSNEPYIWGAGFRSAWLDNLTDAIDNGYLTVAAELGVIGLALWLLQLARAAVSAQRELRFTGRTEYLIALSVIVFFLAESVVARYLLALGNAPSILLILVAAMLPSIRASMRPKQATRSSSEMYASSLK